jgi:SAM-dependent methyltransferase
MQRDYDQAVNDHYTKVAEEEADSPLATMADETVRGHETDTIARFVEEAVTQVKQTGDGHLRVLDVGCGNGYTLAVLHDKFPDISLTGVEKNDALREIAVGRFDDGAVNILSGDMRVDGFFGDEPFDVVFCQRVIINLLDPKDQSAALDNIIRAAKPGGLLLFVEAFQSGLDNLNRARAEFDMAAIPPAHHNLYLNDDFFQADGLAPYVSDSWDIPENLMSTHYFVSRVFHPVILGNRAFDRNSEFVKFFTKALPTGIGDYSQIKLLPFVRTA